jgi:hypothetical protein
LCKLLALSLADTRYNHILAAPCISLWLLYWKRKAIFGGCTSSAAVGLLLLLLAIAGYGASTSLFLGSAALSVAIFCMILAWSGSFLLCYGVAAFQAARFPLTPSPPHGPRPAAADG